MKLTQRQQSDMSQSGTRPMPLARRRPALIPGLVGAGLLTATGAIHLDLYLTGYRTIPVIGWLFLLQVIAAFGLAIFVLATAVAVFGARNGAVFGARSEAGSWIAALAGAGFAASTLGGYLLSVWIGLFGFKEVRTTAGIVAGVIEVAAFAVLAASGVLAARAAGPGNRVGAVVAGIPGAGRAVAGASVLAIVLLGIAVAGAGGAASTAAGTLKTADISGATVLTNAKGLTLYWFAPDTSTKSACYGTCASYWPPVKGPATAGPGVTGTLGALTRTDGSTQATYAGHPLYTYVGDSGPGQASGNNLNLNGGLWHEVTVSG
jgi:predicted lipoprotein with Yx(FWY)xxD motif